MTSSKTYKVSVSHPTGFHTGDHAITVYYYEQTAFQPEHRTCSGGAFGYSRDYFVKTDKEAIAAFLREHACSITKAVKVRNSDRVC